MVMIGDVKEAIAAEKWETVEAWFETNSMDVNGHGFLITLAKKLAPIRMFELLIRTGADANEENQFGDTALTIAIWHRAPLDLIECLLQAGALANHKNQNGNSPITLAAELNRVEVVDLLLRYGAEVDLENNSQDTALTLAIWKRASHELIARLIDAGADVKHQSKSGNSPLALACECNAELRTVKLLLDNGAEVNVANKLGDTPLMLSVWRNCDPALVALLLDEHADVNQRNKDGNSALLLAAQANVRLETMKLLCSNRFVQINLRNKNGDTALTLAAWKNASIGLVKLLLDAGADINSRNQSGNTAHSIAVQAKASPLLIKLLHDYEDRTEGLDFDDYMDAEATLNEILDACKFDSEDARKEYFDKLIEEKFTTWPALRTVDLECLIKHLGIKAGDAVQILSSIEHCERANASLFHSKQPVDFLPVLERRVTCVLWVVILTWIYFEKDWLLASLGLLAIVFNEVLSKTLWSAFALFHLVHAFGEGYPYNTQDHFSLAHFGMSLISLVVLISGCSEVKMNL